MVPFEISGQNEQTSLGDVSMCSTLASEGPQPCWAFLG